MVRAKRTGGQRRRKRGESGELVRGVGGDTGAGFAADADGVLRCFSHALFSRQLYRDAACTQPLHVASHFDPCGGPPPRYAYQTDHEDCAYPTRQFTVGAVVAPPPAAFIRNSGACSPWTFPSYATVYELVEEPASSVTEGRVVID